MTMTISGTSGVTTPSGAVYNGIQSLGNFATTSGTNVTASGIPSWAKRITISFNNTLTSGANGTYIQIGSGSVTTSGYTGGGVRLAGGVSNVLPTNGMQFPVNGNNQPLSGHVVITLVTGNTYSMSGAVSNSNNGSTYVAGATVSLGGALDRINLYAGGDSFTSGNITVFYE